MNWADCGFNCYKVELIKGLLFIQLSWVKRDGKTGYRVTASQSRALKNLFGDLSMAKAAGESFAKKLLEELEQACK